MLSIFDVAASILENTGYVSTMKLQKLASIPLCTLGMESGSAPRLAGVLGIELPVPERFRG